MITPRPVPQEVGPASADPGLPLFYPAEEPHTFYVLPRAPHPEVDGAGHPTLLLTPLGDGAYLQLGARLALDPEALEALRRTLARAASLPDPGQVRLRPAPMDVDGAVLLLRTDEADEASEVARSDTSGYPPYTALFHLRLTAAQREAAEAAVAGRTGHVLLRYAVRLHIPLHVEGRVTGDLGALADRLAERLAGGNADGDAERVAAEVVEEALTRGPLRQTLTVRHGLPDEAPASDVLLDAARARLRYRVAALVLERWRTAPSRTPVAERREAFTLTETLFDRTDRPLLLTTDIAHWPRRGT